MFTIHINVQHAAKPFRTLTWEPYSRVIANDSMFSTYMRTSSGTIESIYATINERLQARLKPKKEILSRCTIST